MFVCVYIHASTVSRLTLSDTSRLKTLIMMTAAEISSGLADHAHRYAMTHADSALRPCSAIKEEMSGIAQVCGSINVRPKNSLFG